MSYLGNSPGLVSQRLVNTFTATASQTTFTTTSTYVVGYVDVFVNGVKLNSADYVASSGSTVVLAEACVVGDIVDVVMYIPRGLTDSYTKLEADLLFQPIDADLTGIAALAGTSGFLKKTGANTWSLDTNSYLTGNQSVSITGDATGSGTTSIAVTLANSGVTAGTYNNVTVNTKGLVTGASNVNYLTSYTETDTLSTVTGRGATTSSAVSITNNTNSTSTTTGALIVAGGVGISGSIYANAIVSVTNINDAAGNVRSANKSGGSAKTSNYVLVASDNGKYVELTSGGSVTVNNSVFNSGDMVTIFNNTTGNVTLTMNITTAYIGGTNTDKNTITLATRGLATILFNSATECVVNGQVS